MGKNNRSILFLHLSDMHIRGKQDINDVHIQKIVDSLNTYKIICVSSIFIIISGFSSNIAFLATSSSLLYGLKE